MIKKIADLVFRGDRQEPASTSRFELERIALQDDYFVTRKLYPNVDFYSGLMYQAMGFPMEMFPVLRHPAHLGLDRAVGRDAARPGAEDRAASQIYVGAGSTRDYVPREQRT